MRMKAGIPEYFVRTIAAFFLLSVPQCLGGCSARSRDLPAAKFDYLTAEGQIGRCGGTLLISERSEPKTFNPLIALDGSSREIIGLIMADLIHINRYTQQTEPALAKSWTISKDGLHYTVHLRRELRFSDGHPFDADDVVFTFECYLDERVHAPQREFLIIDGKPISVRKLDQYTVVFDLARPYAAAERLFDSIWILPEHLLKSAYENGKLQNAWSVNAKPDRLAGLGPFELKETIPGQRIVLQRNPFFWKRDREGNQLPYLDEILCLTGVSSEAQVLRFEAGETDIISRLNAEDFEILKRDELRRRFQLYDAGPGLEYTFLLFNLNDLKAGTASSITEKQKWFRQKAFRQAISYAIDRDAIVRLAYGGRAYPLTVSVSPGDRLWFDSQIPRPSRSVVRAKQLLRGAGFSWDGDGFLRDARGKSIEFSIIHNAGRAQQVQMATLIQQDLKDIGIKVNLVPLDFASLVDRVLNSFSYEAAIMTLADGDSDPNSQMSVWLSNGATHVWSLRRVGPPDEWQQKIDRLMEEQMTTLDRQRRKEIFDRVQDLVRNYEPVVFLVSPDMLAAANERVGNFKPAVLRSYTLWNADQIFIKQRASAPN